MSDACLAAIEPLLGTRTACLAVGQPRATHCRRRRPARVTPPKARPAPPDKLTAEEAGQILDLLRSPRFVDHSPAQVYFTLLDEGTYLASESTCYRLLRQNGEVRERRRQATHPAKVKPELVATAPNTVWSWDITKLKGPKRGEYYDCYVVLDIFSRYAAAWCVAPGESGELAKELIEDAVRRHNVPPGQLTVHADRGSSMTSNPVVELYSFLGIKRSHSRPHVSNDNCYSEAGFKTMKYCPAFPERFGCIEDARAFCQQFFSYYNHDHRHSGISYHTPASIHYGTAAQVRAQRAETLEAAYAANPARFRHRKPEPPKLPTVAWINEPSVEDGAAQKAPAARAAGRLDLDAGLLRVRRALQRQHGGGLVFAEPKTQRSKRTIPLPAQLADVLRQHRVRQEQERITAGSLWQDSPCVFTTPIGTPVDPRNDFREFKKLLDRGSLPSVRLHDLRHTAASLLLAQNVPARVVMEILGHSQIALTMNTYSHVAPEVSREAADRMARMLWQDTEDDGHGRK